MISILSPTRNRPNNIRRLVDSIIDTVNDINNIEFLVYIDDDDEASIPALQEVAEKINTNAIQGNKMVGSQMYNELGKIAQGDIIMFAADDIVFKTKNWDKIVIDKFNEYEDKILFIYGEDGFQHGRIGTHGFIHRFWIDIVGYVLPPKLASAYTDEWITNLAERVDRKLYLSDLFIEHLHPAIGKAQTDSTYSERIEVMGDIGALYQNLEPDRIQDAKKLKEFINIFKS